MYARDERVVIEIQWAAGSGSMRQCTSDESTGPMKTISDAAGIAGKRGARIPILRQPEAPESDSQRRLGPHPRASGPHAPEGAKVLCGTQKKVFGASFERRCVFFFGSFGSSDNILLNGKECC